MCVIVAASLEIEPTCAQHRPLYPEDALHVRHRRTDSHAKPGAQCVARDIKLATNAAGNVTAFHIYKKSDHRSKSVRSSLTSRMTAKIEKGKEYPRTTGTDPNPSLGCRSARMATKWPRIPEPDTQRSASSQATSSGGHAASRPPSHHRRKRRPSRGWHHGRQAIAAPPRTRGRGETPAAAGNTRARSSNSTR